VGRWVGGSVGGVYRGGLYRRWQVLAEPGYPFLGAGAGVSMERLLIYLHAPPAPLASACAGSA
jgi:hypothetical protein